MATANETGNGKGTYTVVEAARRLGLSRNSVYQAINRGELPFLKIGKRLLIPAIPLERLLDGTAGQHSGPDLK